MQSLRSLCIWALSLLPLFTRCAPTSSFQLLPENIIITSLAPYGEGRGESGNTSPSSFAELQLNLCNSGYAKCYHDGDSIPQGGDLIYKTGPNIVTINEICSNDVTELQSNLRGAWPNDYTYSVFMPAIDKRNNGAYKCKNGFMYGSVVLGRVASASWQGVEGYGGLYTSQDGENEQRIFVCASATGDHVACATHLSSTAEPIALAQCKALLFDAVPYIKSASGSSAKTVVGGDFNLEYDTEDPENAQNCVPSGWTRKGDNSVQHVVYTNDLTFEDSEKFSLSKTDHKGFLVKLTTA